MAQKGPLCVTACYIMWGLLPIFWKQLAAVDSMYVLGSRILWSVIFLAVILGLQRRGAALRAVEKEELLRLALAGVFVCINWGVYIWSVNNGHMLDASLAYYMNPILSILLGTIVFRERLTRIQWLSVGVTFIGLVITIVRYRQVPWMALVMGGSFAIYGAIKKRVHTEAGISVFYETLTLMPFALAFLTVMEVRGSGAIGVLQGWQWLLLPAAGVVTTVPLLFYAVGMQNTSMSLAGILMYVSPTLQLLVSVWLYHEEFTTTHAILFGFVWSGLVLYLLSGWIDQRRHGKEEVLCG